jgi:hypothetical protein
VAAHPAHASGVGDHRQPLRNNWSLYVLLAWLLSYFKATFNVLRACRLLSAALPGVVPDGQLCGSADRLLRQGRSATYVRKLMQGSGCLAAPLPPDGPLVSRPPWVWS